MIGKSPEFLYIGFILPTLFALTLVGEGIYKISKNEEGFFTFILGIFFLVGVIIGYFFLFLK
ncbi:hypothetical protein A3J15_01640 [Candidatus Roizmanbacteria bacterium RIFCSPLOWO2_02_FULL_38_10]|uniref:Uncharacterized protein n=1 Tax=Candidatus Roizmanbacteria bacterium RIFCSPLOWO2_02_FULL_38_10 TaxID=1802074 RepID=A0A1F7JLT7_9BACT|nr:MAG: hypothetical protein A3J15_01640 [Candidatus Roizmanbacteria bacterium RIFCSPLOWO2_02_FULL_38_10]